MSGMRLNIKLGFGHPVVVSVPGPIKAEVPHPTKIVLNCTDKHKLGARFSSEDRQNHIKAK
jgi:large subunit ribosomal protein L6